MNEWLLECAAAILSGVRPAADPAVEAAIRTIERTEPGADMHAIAAELRRLAFLDDWRVSMLTELKAEVSAGRMGPEARSAVRLILLRMLAVLEED